MSGKIWHEARRQEKKIRGMMVDFRKRAERRREYYERIKLDPTQFLQLHGRPIKIHLDPQIANAAEGPQSMMPWQGDSNNMIDRFDVRAHLDFIPEYKPGTPVELSATEADEERRSNYERYRVLVQNDMTGVSETLCLRQIYLDEKYGAIEDKQKEKEQEMEKKKIAAKKAAIGFTYEDSTPAEEEQQEEADEEKDSEEESDLSDEEIDLDMVVDVDELTEEQVKKFNLCATLYGMEMGDYVQSLRNDKEEQEQIRLARLLEEEKAQFAGRKSRRERRAYKEKKLRERHLSPPSYAARSSPTYEPMSKNFGSGGRKSRRSSSSRSRSRSPETGGIQLITSFGGDSSGEEGKVQVIHGPSLPQHMLPRSLQDSASSHKPSRSRSKHSQDRSRRNSRWDRHGNRRRSSSSRSRSRSRSHRRQRTRSKSRDRGYRRRTRSNSRSRRFTGGRNRRSYSRSRSRSRGRRRSRSRSHSRSRSRSRKRSNVSRSRSRSRSHSKTPPPRPVLPAPTLIRYRQSSSSSSSSSDNDTADSRKNVKTEAAKNLGNSTNKSGTKGGISAAEKLKRRMQLALNKQQRADKMARLEKKEKEIQERMDREDELRSMAIEMRRREREKRHRDREDYYNEPLPEEPRSVKSEERVSRQKVKRSRSRSHSHSPRRRHHRSRSRSRNRSGRRSSPRLVDY